MQRLLIFLLIIHTALLLVSCSKIKSLSSSPAHDGFDSSTLSDIWETDKIVSSDAELQSKVVRSGHGAIKITIHSGDKFEVGQHGSLSTERAELTEAEQLISYEGKTYSYKFSMYIPTDFPIVPTRLVIAQWKQECPRGGICDDNSPVLALRYVSGVLRVTQNIGDHQTTFYRSQKELRGRWLDFEFHICFSSGNNGSIYGSIDDSTIVNYRGPTTYKETKSTGYPVSEPLLFQDGSLPRSYARTNDYFY